jgi:Protein of unknown function (DUF2934)
MKKEKRRCVMSEKDLFDEIARMAYELWERNGCIHGCDIEHWCEAESIVISRMEVVPEEKTKKAGTPRKTTAKATKKASSPASKTRKTSGSAKKA